MNKDSLGDRMKENYENRYRFSLTRRTPVIIRIDGKAFHTFTKEFVRPFDYIMAKSMAETAMTLCKEIMGCQLAYTQSDEISLLLIDYKKLTSEAWFDNNLQKIVSVAASIATLAFNKAFRINSELLLEDGFYKNLGWSDYVGKYYFYTKQHETALFDARAFNIPESEVCNYFIWRQQDATRNSIESAGHAYFSNKELHRVNCSQIQEKLFKQKQINWNNYPTIFRRGACIKKDYFENQLHGVWTIDTEIPVFSQNRAYIENLLLPEV